MPSKADEGIAVSRLSISNRHLVVVAALLLVTPNVLFAADLSVLPAFILLAASLGVLAISWRSASPTASSLLDQPIALRRFGLCVLVSVGLLVVGGETHLVYTNWDWLWRDAVLADLARGPLLPTYQVSGDALFLRAPLGMYLLPALVARAAGLVAGHVAMLAQNALLLGLTLYTLATMAQRRGVLVVAVFLSFSGIDVLGEMLTTPGGHPLPSHIEWWAGTIQYSSVVTQLFWCPNHALPAFWLTMLTLLCGRRELDIAALLVVLAASLLWSPFAFIGTLPFAAFLVLRDWRVLLPSPRFWLAVAAALGFLPVAFYLKIDAAQVPHEIVLFMPGMAALIALFLAIEIPHVAVIFVSWRQLELVSRGCVIVAVSLLVVLPTVRFGLANDFVMRASIPALMIVSVAFAEALAKSFPARPLVGGIGMSLIALGAVTPYQEIARSFAFSAFVISDCNLLTVWKKIGKKQPRLENYLAEASSRPSWLKTDEGEKPLQNQGERTCWPDLPVDPYLHITRHTNEEIRKLSADLKTRAY